MPKRKPTKRPGSKTQVLKKYRDFAHLVVSGQSQAQAYKIAISPSAQESTANSKGCRLANRPDIKAYIQSLKEASWTANVLTLAEKRSFLADVVRTPVGEVDETSKLAQEVTYEETKNGTTRKVKMVSKAQAIDLDSKLAGDYYSDRQGNSGNPFGWLVVMHKAKEENEEKVIEIGNSSTAVIESNAI